LAEQRKAFETERVQITEQRTREEQQWAVNPVHTGLSKMYERLAHGLHPQQQEQLGSMFREFAQILQSDGLFNPQQLQAQAQQQQFQQQQTQYQQTERVIQAERAFWGFQKQIGKVLNDQEKGDLLRVITERRAPNGAYLDFPEAWRLVQQEKAAAVRPVATVSPAKRGQQLKRTAERGTASSSPAGEDPLDLARQVLAEYQA
jgi:hypothetical protein